MIQAYILIELASGSKIKYVNSTVADDGKDAEFYLYSGGSDEPATVTGTIDMSSGNDWATTAQSFGIDVGGGVLNVPLSANCANQTAVLAEITAKLAAAGATGVQAVDGGSGLVTLETTVGHLAGFTLSAGGVDALATLGISTGAYVGVDAGYEDQTGAGRIKGDYENLTAQIVGFSTGELVVWPEGGTDLIRKNLKDHKGTSSSIVTSVVIGQITNIRIIEHQLNQWNEL